jgi:hypothetical protein
VYACFGIFLFIAFPFMVAAMIRHSWKTNSGGSSVSDDTN